MLKKILAWFDQNILLALSLFLLVFIPLYPKWPLFDVLPGYNVKVRLEDFLIAITYLIWFVQVLRRRIDPTKIPLFKPLLIYIAVGFLSSLSAIFITQTITTELYQIAKLFLHFFRNLEYIALFFVFYSAVKSIHQVKYFLWATLATTIAVTIYGYGQKFYYYWPAYSTMNREFSKGIPLYLTEHARVQSTFGGHYDLAAYVMMVLILILIWFFYTKKSILKLVLFITFLSTYYILILTASRASFAGFIGGMTLTFFLIGKKKGWIFASSRWLVSIVICMAIMVSFGPLAERFANLIRLDDLMIKYGDTIGNLREKYWYGPKMADRPTPTPTPKSGKDQLKQAASQSDVPPSKTKPSNGKFPEATSGGFINEEGNWESSASASVDENSERPSDVYVDPYNQNQATNSASLDEGGNSQTLTYSENSLKYGLSTGIRLDTLWPRAWQGFTNNIFLGSGYSSLTKRVVWEQTTAESTDNNFLRILGETGLLGFLAYMNLFAVCIGVLYKGFKETKDQWFAALFASGIGITVALMLNALYIDVFVSSKVAFIYWGMMGILTITANLQIQPVQKNKNKIKSI